MLHPGFASLSVSSCHATRACMNILGEHYFCPVFLGYVCFILVFNGVSFCIILACYLCMYLSIRHSQAWNSNDTRVAKRMALLVFTDFLCWAPIAFFSLGASFGKNLIDLSGAKVRASRARLASGSVCVWGGGSNVM